MPCRTVNRILCSVALAVAVVPDTAGTVFAAFEVVDVTAPVACWNCAAAAFFADSAAAHCLAIEACSFFAGVRGERRGGAMLDMATLFPLSRLLLDLELRADSQL
jgi:hypothetical protein